MSLRSVVSSVLIACVPLGTLAYLPACGGDDFQPDNAGSGGQDGGAGAGGGSAATAGATGDGPNGAACSDDSSCKSGSCVDGVCCESACDGACESCALPGSQGTCTPHAAGTDPDAECVGGGKPGDICAGTCNGASACDFPNQTKSCGESSCQDNLQTADVCGGDGTCVSAETDCGDYGCGATSCNTSCTDGSQCASDAWCDGSQCMSKKGNGAACGSAEQCQSGFCEGQTCCATACAAPAACNEGTCECGGVVCAAGKQCVVWYLDQDGDGFGASSASNLVGCEGQPPLDPSGKQYYPSTAPPDCDDTNANVFPGQTKYFTAPYGAGSWDYDCNGKSDLQYTANAAASCSVCCTTNPCVGCQFAWYASCTPKAQIAFTGTFAPSCGQTANAKQCGGATCAPMKTISLTQGCR